MSRARLRELRMVGFKSFAERTVVSFGPGISAIVGPNGSGKSNLADALRWTLGEQGRALRTRRAEDLIFAGSAMRRAVGMADVGLLIDNADGLLPVDFAEVELSRRLYRSGENEYLLNRQRIRLRDLVELLDDANLADNAFLFIGQGMVDQALALRPEERRPLFEEAAGIRKHERRRRQAEADLLEAGANVERVRDLLAELRPQARRLAAQAEQQEARDRAGLELAGALVVATRARLMTAEQQALRHAEELASAHREADAALAALREAEEASNALAGALSDRADEEVRLRQDFEDARARVVELRLQDASCTSEATALVQRRQRLAGEREALSARVDLARRELAAELPEPDVASEDALADAERRLETAARDAQALRDAGREQEARSTALRAARERLAVEHERAQRRLTDSERRLAEQQRTAQQTASDAGRAGERLAKARAAMTEAQEAEAVAEAALGEARARLTETEGEADATRTRAADLRGRVGSLEGQAAILDRQLEGGTDDRALRSARARGGRRLSEGLEVEPGLRLAVEAALRDALTGLVLGADDALALHGSAAVIVLRDAAGRPGEGARVADRGVSRLEAAVSTAGGGPLAGALRRDPDGLGARLLVRSSWLPDLAAALQLRSLLPQGWRLVTRDGEVVDDLGVVRPAPAVSLLDLRARQADVVRQLGEARRELDAAQEQATRAEGQLREAEAAWRSARGALEHARRQRRVAEEQERAAARAAEAAAREDAWSTALLERVTRELAIARDEEQERARELESQAGSSVPGADGGTTLAAAEARLATLRAERNDRARAASEARSRREAALEARRRAEISLALASARGEELDGEAIAIGRAEADLAATRDRLAEDLAAAAAHQERARSAFEASVAASRDERARLLASEAVAAASRERLRVAESRSRQAEVAEMEARLQLDAARQGLLVELASIGSAGLEALRVACGSDVGDAGVEAGAVEEGSDDHPGGGARGEDLSTALEATLAAALQTWRQVDAAATDSPPSPGPGRLSALRRRFHELGASNPFAAQELSEVNERLSALEAQRDDLERAIAETRELMARLDGLISEQFRQTFAALEGAFGRRFRQLFGGGEAELSLTAPQDLAATGVEITARPPGKKRQPLAMLSGGERALTAVALLLAMLEVRPVPFCVLDEVDAALDEANIGRFSKALRGLAETIQFIVITHNRGTIEAADALYGVTVGDDAVSRVVSLRLSDVADAPGIEAGTTEAGTEAGMAGS